MTKHYKIKIIAALMLLLGAVSVFYIFILKSQQDAMLERIIIEEKARAKSVYGHVLEEVYKKYRFIAQNILLDPKLLHAVAQADYETLYTLTKPYYEKFKADNPHLGIMHFHLPNGRSLLRLHDSMMYGDDLTYMRPMIVDMNRKKTTLEGLEVGVYGIHYRVGVPMIQDEQHIGILEFGVSIEHVVQTLKVHDQLESIVFINKAVLDQKPLTQCQSIHDCQTVAGSVSYAFGDGDLTAINENYLLIEHEGKQQMVFKGADLLDYQGREVGQIYLIKAIDYVSHNLNQLLISSIVMAFLLMLVSYWILDVIFRKFTHKITMQHQQLELKTRAMEKLANHDFLTKTFNRRRIDEVLKLECLRTKRYETPFSIILFDIDDFKVINDTYGHNSGDKVLRVLAKNVASAIRNTDYFGRWGGEEFIIVLPQTVQTQAMELAEKLRKVVESLTFEFVERVTCSFGVTQCQPDDAIDISIQHADLALYEAKSKGKNCVKAWEQKSNDLA